MTMQQQGQRIDASQTLAKARKRLSKRIIVDIIVVIIAIVVAVIWILNILGIIRGSWTPIFTGVFALLSTVFALLQMMHPASSPSQQLAPIIVQIPSTATLPSQPSFEKPALRGISGFPPLTDGRAIQKRAPIVSDVYTKLVQDNVVAIALTGIGGVGKSTLAALIYRYTENQRQNHSSRFLAETLWLTIDPAVTFADLVGNLFEALGKPLPDLGKLAPQNQAVALFNVLNDTDKPRLIILDQFENLLDWDTGHALTDRPGVGEWLDIINSQRCACRILLTSRPRPVGSRESTSMYLQEYAVSGLKTDEGIALLKSRDVLGSEKELQNAVKYCDGHAFSLTLLATLMRDHHINLTILFKNSALWTGDIATYLLDQIYTQKLNDSQRELLLAFCVFREPVPIEAALELIPEESASQVFAALKTLVTQHLLEAEGEGCYQLHAIIAQYAQRHFGGNNAQAREESLRTAHAGAAQYYLQRAENSCPSRGNRQKVSDVHDLIESIWQYCQAEKWQEAYNLMINEEIFGDLNHWGSNAILIELYQLLLTDKWHSQPSEMALIYKNLGSAYNDLGRLHQAQVCFEKALILWKESNDIEAERAALSNSPDSVYRVAENANYVQRMLCATLNSLGSVHRDLGQKEQGRAYLVQALEIARNLGIRKEESVALTNLAVIYADFGQKEQARMCCEQASEICREISDSWGEGWANNMLGLIYIDLEQKEQAQAYLTKALETRQKLGNRLGEGRTTNHLGRVHIMLGKSDDGTEYCQKALNIAKAIGDFQGEGKAYINLGWASIVLEEGEQARKYSEQALVILREIGDRGMEARALFNLGLACSLLTQQEEAFNSYREALSIFKEINDCWREGETLFEIGKLYFERAHYDTALACFLITKKVFTELQNPLLKEAQIWIEKIQNELGDEQFVTLLATVELHAQEIVDQALSAGIE